MVGDAVNSQKLSFYPTTTTGSGGKAISGNAVRRARKRSSDVEPCNSLSMVPIIGGKRDPLDEAQEVID
jgi:hypothetical protein